MKSYRGHETNEIIFPLGGIGTGSVGLAGNGQLVDWEIQNRPDKGSRNGYSHFAVKATREGKVLDARVLQGDVRKDLMGQYSKKQFSGYGFGPASQTMAGYRHFRDCVFRGAFPFAELDFSDPSFPGSVRLTAFNPFIPMNADDSSLPAAFFALEFTNSTQETLTYSAAFSVGNPFRQSVNRREKKGNFSFIRLSQSDSDPSDVHCGDLTLAADCESVEYQEYWYRGKWQDNVTRFWRQFTSGEPLANRSYPEPGKRDHATLCASVAVKPGETREIRFLLSWNFPNQYNYWDPVQDENGKDLTWKNHYATRFSDSEASALYALENWERLRSQSEAFRNAFWDSTLPEEVLEAAGANLAVLKSPTVLRLEDGSFYGWEGVHEESGSCEGTCQHVWNYAYALPYLFPELERSVRELEFDYNTDSSGHMRFRLPLPVGKGKGSFISHHACVDGQMGTVIKCYREWKLSGDDAWLRKRWKDIQRVLEYAWSKDNRDKWDENKSGVLTGRQHHTLDMELFGPSSWLEGFYLAALKAAREMAEYLGDREKASEYGALFCKGYAWTKENLFNGRYFFQKIDLTDRSLVSRFEADSYWNEETGEIKYQIGEGSEIDQLCAQWHADILGLGDIFDPDQRREALKHLYAHNYKPTMRDFDNMWRVYSLNDEAGAVICDYSADAYRPTIPIPYCDETMTGFEYQLAGLLISEGMEEEGRTLVRAVRDRYAGHNRNPWNEIECGSNYARSMASYALIPLYSGFVADLPHGRIAFKPVIARRPFRCFWSVDGAWGTVEFGEDFVRLRVLCGALTLGCLGIPSAESAIRVEIDSEEKEFAISQGEITFAWSRITDQIRVDCSKESARP